MEITEWHIRTVRWMVKLNLKLAHFTFFDPGSVWTCVIMEQITTVFVSSYCLLFLMDVCRLWIVSQYTSEIMAPLYSRNSTIVDLERRKRRWATPCLLILQSGFFMIPKEILKYDPHIQFLLLVSDSFWNPMLAHFPIKLSLIKIVRSIPTLTSTFLANIRSVTWQSLSTKSSTLSMRLTVMTVFAWTGLGSSTSFSWPARKRAVYFFTDLSDTQFHTWTVTIRWWIAASLTPSAVRNWIMSRWSSIVEFWNTNTILFLYRVKWTALFIRASDLYFAFSLLLRIHSPIYNEDSNCIPKCLATFPLNGTVKYANGYVVMKFRTFSFDPLYIGTIHCYINIIISSNMTE